MARLTLLSYRCAAAVALLLTTAAVNSHRPLLNNGNLNIVEEQGSPSMSKEEPAAPVVCSSELNSYCPPNTKCCPKYGSYSKSSLSASDSRRLEKRPIVGYSCLLSWAPSRIPQGPCCDDDDDDDIDDYDNDENYVVTTTTGSGCAIGYKCAAAPTIIDDYDTSAPPSSFVQDVVGVEQKQKQQLAQVPHCQLDEKASRNLMDKVGRPIVNDYERTPRYTTCPAFKLEEIERPFGLPIPFKAGEYNKNSKSTNDNVVGDSDAIFNEGGVSSDGDGYMGQLAYFTNMGPLSTSSDTSSSSPSHADVTTAVIGIHGSGRDASSYLCAMIAATVTKKKKTTTTDNGGGDEEAAAGGVEDDNRVRLNNGVVSTTLLRGRRRVQDGGEQDIPNKKKKKKDEILVIAPWFLAPADGDPASSTSSPVVSSLPFLQWVDKASVSHTFRYGAESIGVLPIQNDPEDANGKTTTSSATATISSYGAMDVLLETLCDKANYPKLERIVVAGHSAGGQFVHRWGLTSDSWCFGDSDDEKKSGIVEPDNRDLPLVRLVVANPRSYAYLDKRRYFPPATDVADQHAALQEEGDGEEETLSPFDKLEFRTPTSSELDDCQEYNQYCWGLEDNPNLAAPYITNNVDKLSMSNADDDVEDNTDLLFCRYASRSVVYLSGQRDTKQLGNQICDEDGYQGPSRRERSERFFASLQVRGDEILRSSYCARGGGRGDALEEEEQGSDGVESFAAEMSRVKGEFCALRHDAVENDDGEKNVQQVHDRIVVEHVGHDHALIFQSEEGRDGMFG